MYDSNLVRQFHKLLYLQNILTSKIKIQVIFLSFQHRFCNKFTSAAEAQKQIYRKIHENTFNLDLILSNNEVKLRIKELKAAIGNIKYGAR